MALSEAGGSRRTGTVARFALEFTRHRAQTIAGTRRARRVRFRKELAVTAIGGKMRS